MKKFALLPLFLAQALSFAQTQVKVATFDSGFGGYFTAKEIEKQSTDLLKTFEGSISISHYGDTANAPYGEKTPEKIAELSAKGITKAFDDGAETVFIACNTASTQYNAIKSILNKAHPGRGDRIVSIIDSSVQALRGHIDEKLKKQNTVHVALLATPATIRAGAYLEALARSYQIPLPQNPLRSQTQTRWYKMKGNTVESVASGLVIDLPQGKKIILSQIGPANWVDMIEHGASADVKMQAIGADLELLAARGNKWDVVGEFCTHFPAVDDMIKKQSVRLGLSTPDTIYIKQGPLMAGIFRKMMVTRLKPKNSKYAAAPVHADIFISGDNLQETAELAREIFPNDPAPRIEQKSF